MLTIRMDRLRALGLRPGDRVLDAGSGFGRHAFELARQGYRVAALDVAAPELKSTRDTFAAMVEAGEIDEDRVLGVVCGDATQLPFADGTFDGVVASEVLEHVQDDVGALAELVRVLRPGGALAVTVPSWLPEKINWMLSDDYHAPAAVGGHVRIYSATELKAKLRGSRVACCGYATTRTPSTHRTGGCAAPSASTTTATRWCVGTASSSSGTSCAVPRSVAVVERVLSPALGKSLVVYAS